MGIYMFRWFSNVERWQENTRMLDRLLNWLKVAGQISHLYPKFIYFAMAQHVRLIVVGEIVLVER